MSKFKNTLIKILKYIGKYFVLIITLGNKVINYVDADAETKANDEINSFVGSVKSAVTGTDSTTTATSDSNTTTTATTTDSTTTATSDGSATTTTSN